MDQTEGLKILELIDSIQIIERKLTMSLVDSGLRMPQYRVLVILKDSSSTVSDLSKKLRITRAAASLLVNEMIKQGYCQTRENEIDRRSFHIVISDAGLEKLNVAHKNVSAAGTKLSRDMSNEEIHYLNHFASKIISGEK